MTSERSARKTAKALAAARAREPRPKPIPGLPEPLAYDQKTDEYVTFQKLKPRTPWELAFGRG